MPKVSYHEPKVLSVPRAGLGRALPVALDAANDRNWRIVLKKSLRTRWRIDLCSIVVSSSLLAVVCSNGGENAIDHYVKVERKYSSTEFFNIG